MNKKEELRNKLDEVIKLYPECFEHISDYGRMLIFNLFYAEIERRETEMITKNRVTNETENELRTKLQSLEQLLKAADEVIENEGKLLTLMSEGTIPLSYAQQVNDQSAACSKSLESYTTLKQQMK